MARIFLSYDDANREFARQLEQALADKGHQSAWGVDELIAGRGWGELMPKRLSAADALVAILTAEAVQSPTVLAEVGAARALAAGAQRVALLPVLVGLERAPGFVQDILVLKLSNGLPQLAGEIDRAISAHLKSVEVAASRSTTPKIFISHRHKDQGIAKALAEVLSTAFELSPSDIRCTSVQPYRLPFGKNTGERLRDEVKNAKAVLGILSPDTSESSYTMFELGAAWAQRVYTCPLLSRGAVYGDIPGPIFDLAPAKLWVESDGHQLLHDLEVELELKRRQGIEGSVSEKVRALAEASKPVVAASKTSYATANG